MKKILGLDLGTTFIGWALVNEAETEKWKIFNNKTWCQSKSFNRRRTYQF